MAEKKYITLGDVDHSLGDKGNMAGIISRIIYGYHEDVAVWPEEPLRQPAGDLPAEDGA